MLPVPLTSPLTNAVAGDGGLQPSRACRVTYGPNDSCFPNLVGKSVARSGAPWPPSSAFPTMPRISSAAPWSMASAPGAEAWLAEKPRRVEAGGEADPGEEEILLPERLPGDLRSARLPGSHPRRGDRRAGRGGRWPPLRAWLGREGRPDHRPDASFPRTRLLPWTALHRAGGSGRALAIPKPDDTTEDFPIVYRFGWGGADSPEFSQARREAYRLAFGEPDKGSRSSG